MQIHRYALVTALGGFLCLPFADAAVHYVNVNNASPTAPYTNWATAANVIQDAVDVASAGDEIVVTNGVYQSGGRAVHPDMTNRVAVNRPLTVRSVNGPDLTVICGYQPGTVYGNGAVRCVYLANDASLVGFTLTNGATARNSHGGGVWCESGSATVSNCVLVGNVADLAGGGAWSGTLNRCTLIGNAAVGNSGSAGGGGAAAQAILNHCIVSNNQAEFGGGVLGGTLNNCILLANSAHSFYPFPFVMGGGAHGATLNNCTVTDNSARDEGGGVFGGALNNCIVYYNSASSAPNCSDALLNHSCTTPLPTNGVGNITNAPLFVDAAAGDFRLQSNSPCINAGRNAHAPTGPDLDGNPPIVGGTTDIGAYEFQSPQSAISYAWLRQFGLHVDGSADFTDSDGDGHNNWQEWRTWTDPTNAASALRFLSPTISTNGLLVRWQSVSGQNYFLERSTGLGAQAVFAPVASGLISQPGVTTHTDTNTTGTGPFFYRVGVRP